MKRTTGQSILEYVILLTLIIAGLVFAGRALFRPAVQSALTDQAAIITNSGKNMLSKIPVP